MKNEKLSIIAIILSICVLLANYFGIERFITSNKLSIWPILIFIGVVFLIFLGYFIILLIFKKFKPDLYQKWLNLFFEEEEFDGEKYIDDLRTKITEVEENKENKNNDILELMLENMKEIRDYYVISKKQAKNAFSLSVYMCIFGIFLIALSVVLSITLDLSLAVTLIPAIGGAIAELIAGTALMVYKTSLVQLNNYYEALHNNERFLSLVNLVSKISLKKQDEVYMNIINIELENYRK